MIKSLLAHKNQR